MRRPIFIFGTQRSGSTLLTELLFHLGRDALEYKNCLMEVFGYFENESLINYRKRINIVLDMCFAGNYCFKIFPEHYLMAKKHLGIDLIQLLGVKYDIVYIERKNRWNQFMSILAHQNTHDSGYAIDDIELEKVTTIKYTKSLRVWTQKTLYDYYVTKAQYQSKYQTVYFEELTQSENKLDFLNKIFMLASNVPNIEIKSNKVRYEGDVIDLVENKDQLLQDKEKIIAELTSLKIY